MDAIYWHKQTDQPLYPEIEWNKPERRDQSGKLLIIGGNKSAFASVASAYQDAQQNGAGEIRIILPDSLRHLPVIQNIPECILVKSNKSGALGLQAWNELQASFMWADWVLLAGDLSHNPETIQLLQKVIGTNVPLSIASSVLPLVLPDIADLAERPLTIVECDFTNLQKIANLLKHPQALTSTMSLGQLVDNLHQITTARAICLITNFNGVQLIAHEGQVSTTKSSQISNHITKATVYAMHNPSQLFQSTSQSVWPTS